ncbi:recombinase family protein [Trichocoleus sp. FACHB-262]|uniref:recombinase family protein n=1 Tax=Trichocoleus sp. FACHB-262 TaxID=2692869 RepID=UPI001682FAE8|nr:recombinase family protein [Trichocoleus sp. FACHB-262]
MFEGKIKTVVVWKLDRILHRLKDGINRLTSRCEQGVRVVSVTQQINLNGRSPVCWQASCSNLLRSS